MPTKEIKPYRRYTNADGKVIEFTKEEFEQIVDVFRILINSKREREGKAPLLGQNDSSNHPSLSRTRY